MAVKAPMRPTLGRISRVIADYARAQGLDRSEFALVGSCNDRTDRISLVLGTTRPLDELRWYSEILENLRRDFEEIGRPWVAWNIGLVFRRVDDLERVYLDFLIGDDDEDVTGLLEDGVKAAWDSSQTRSASAGESNHGD